MKMNQAGDATRQMSQESATTRSGMNQLTDAVHGFVAGIAVQEVINFATDMTNLGREVDLTQQRFESLIAPMGDAEAVLVRLRDAALGIATDNQLREGSNLLMMTGIASSPEDLENIISLITRTKKPTEDLSSAIENFSLMMANQSLLRLDSFGLSSGRVRARILELIDAGQALNREEAFKMAVMEEGAKLMDRLGDSTEAAATTLARAEVSWQNFWDSFAKNLAEGVEGVMGLGELALGIHPAQQQVFEAQMQALAEDMGAVLTMAFNDPMFKDALPVGFVESFVRESLLVAQNSPGLTADMRAFTGQVLRNIGGENYMGGNMMSDIHLLAEATLQIQAGNAALREQTRLTDEAAQAEAERLSILEEEQRLQKIEGERAQLRGQMGADFFALEAQLAGLGVPRGFMDLMSGDFGVQRYMKEEDAIAFGEAAEEADRLLEDMQRLDELDPELFTDAQIEQMETIAKAAGELAKEADKAYVALEKIKLTDVFGQGADGAEGLAAEIGDMTAEQMRAAGASDEQIAAFQREMNMATGRETLGSVTLEEQIAPLVADVAANNPQLATEIAENLGRVYYEAAARGIDVNDPAFQAALLRGMGIAAGAGETITIKPGDTISGLAPGVGMSPEELMSALGISNPRMLQPGQFALPGAEVDPGAVEDFDTEAFFTDYETFSVQTSGVQEAVSGFITDMSAAVEPTADVETSFGLISTHATTLKNAIEVLTSRVQQVTVKVKVDYDDPNGYFSDAMRQATRDNGGVPPGSSRSGPS